MNKFLNDYIDRLKALKSEDDIRDIYHWFWDRPREIRETSIEINERLSLHGAVALKPDMPCLTTGSRKRLLVVAFNPSWHVDDNKQEELICRKSEDDYLDLMLNYFDQYPKQIRLNNWWSRPISFIRLLRGQELFGENLNRMEKWQAAHDCGLIGGWEIFPFHSPKDGLSRFVPKFPWLKSCAEESLKAAARMKPDILFIASRIGRELALYVWPDFPWIDQALGENRLSYCPATRDHPETVAVSCQLSAPRKFYSEDLLRAVKSLRP